MLFAQVPCVAPFALIVVTRGPFLDWMRGPHALCVNFTLGAVCDRHKASVKPLGIVHVAKAGLVMKPRGVILDSIPKFLRPRLIPFFFSRRIFFPFDPDLSFL